MRLTRILVCGCLFIAVAAAYTQQASAQSAGSCYISETYDAICPKGYVEPPSTPLAPPPAPPPVTPPPPPVTPPAVDPPPPTAMPLPGADTPPPLPGEEPPECTATEDTPPPPPVPDCSPGPRGYVKFFKGHYLTVKSDKGGEVNTALAQMRSAPAIRGFSKWYVWADIEPTKDGYDFAEIRADIAKAKAENRKLGIWVVWKFGRKGGGSPMPDYLAEMTCPYHRKMSGGGLFAKGWNIALDNPVVADRFKLLLKALAEEFDEDMTVSTINFPETSLAMDMTREEEGRFFDNLEDVHRYASCVFRHTPVIQLTNYPTRILVDEGMVLRYPANGVGLGGPDIFIDRVREELWQPGKLYTFYDDVERQVPIGMVVAGENFLYSTYDDFQEHRPHGLSHEESVTRLAVTGKDYLFANYIWWNSFGPGDAYANMVVTKVRNGTLPALDGSCPTIYSGLCIDP